MDNLMMLAMALGVFTGNAYISKVVRNDTHREALIVGTIGAILFVVLWSICKWVGIVQ